MSEHSVYREFLWRAPETGLHPAISDVPPPVSLITGNCPIGFRVEGAIGSVGTLTGTSSFAFTPTGLLSSGGFITGTSSWVFTPTGLLTSGQLMTASSAWLFTPSGVMTGGSSPITGTSTWTFTPSAAIFDATVNLTGTAGIRFTVTGRTNNAMSASVPWGWRPEGNLTNSALTGTATLTFAPTGLLEDGGVAFRLGVSFWTFTPSGVLTDTGFVPPRSGSLDAAPIPGPRGEELVIVEIAPWLLKALVIVETGQAVGDVTPGSGLTLDSTVITLDQTDVTLDQTEVATP